MASLMKLGRITAKLPVNSNGHRYNIVRHVVPWNSLWKPGQFPKTEEERKKAAEKYGLLEEEYETYPDEGNYHGDYPKCPDIGVASRDPYYPWDFPEDRRNFNDVVPAEISAIGEERYNPSVKHKYPPKYYFLTFLCVMAGFACLQILCENYFIYYRPVMEKQLPKPGVAHYTFEPAK